MITRFTMKTPDVLDKVIEDIVQSSMPLSDPDNDEETELDLDEEYEYLVEKYKKQLEQWVKYGELVTIEVDFEENTCKVIEV